MSHEHKPQTLTKNNFSEEVLESSRPVLVDFWADWCAPCRAVAPVVDQVADQFEDQLTVGKVNVDEEPELAHPLEQGIGEYSVTIKFLGLWCYLGIHEGSHRLPEQFAFDRHQKMSNGSWSSPNVPRKVEKSAPMVA